MIRASPLIGTFCLILPIAAYAKDDERDASKCKYADQTYSYGSIMCQAGKTMRCEGPGEPPNNHIHWFDTSQQCAVQSGRVSVGHPLHRGRRRTSGTGTE